MKGTVPWCCARSAGCGRRACTAGAGRFELSLLHYFKEATLGPLFDALARNTHLRSLLCHGCMTEPFALERLLPAVRANTSLLRLQTGRGWVDPTSAREAEALVAQQRRRTDDGHSC
jgi:hypothetical protein